MGNGQSEGSLIAATFLSCTFMFWFLLLTWCCLVCCFVVASQILLKSCWLNFNFQVRSPGRTWRAHNFSKMHWPGSKLDLSRRMGNSFVWCFSHQFGMIQMKRGSLSVPGLSSGESWMIFMVTRNNIDQWHHLTDGWNGFKNWTNRHRFPLLTNWTSWGVFGDSWSEWVMGNLPIPLPWGSVNGNLVIGKVGPIDTDHLQLPSSRSWSGGTGNLLSFGIWNQLPREPWRRSFVPTGQIVWLVILYPLRQISRPWRLSWGKEMTIKSFYTSWGMQGLVPSDRGVFSSRSSKSRISCKCPGLNQQSGRCCPDSRLRSAPRTTSNKHGIRWSGSAASSRPWMWRVFKGSSRRRSTSRRLWYPLLLPPSGRQWCLLGKWSGPWNRVRLPLALSPIPKGSRHVRPLMLSSWGWSGFRWVAVPASMICSTPARARSRWHPPRLRWWHGRPRQLQPFGSRRTRCRWSHPSLPCQGRTGGQTGLRLSRVSTPWRDSRTWTTWSQRWAKISRGWSPDLGPATVVFDGWKRPWSDKGLPRTWCNHCHGIPSGSSSQTVHTSWESLGHNGNIWGTGRRSPLQTSTPGRNGMWWWTYGGRSSQGFVTSISNQERKREKICPMKTGMTSQDLQFKKALLDLRGLFNWSLKMNRLRSRRRARTRVRASLLRGHLGRKSPHTQSLLGKSCFKWSLQMKSSHQLDRW